MDIRQSINLKKFKNEIGQSNHILITILVGLEAIANPDYNIQINEDFKTSWNPLDKIQSANRSKSFAKKAALSWVIDNLDSYFLSLNQEPYLIDDEAIRNKFNGASGIRDRFDILKDYLTIDPIKESLVDLAISWRNRLIHSGAKTDISFVHRKCLLNNKKFIENEYRHMDIEIALDSFDKKETPSFKETTSFIKTIIDFVYEIDNVLVNMLNKLFYTTEIINRYFKENKGALLKFENNDSDTKKRQIHNILKTSCYRLELPNTELDNFINMYCN